MKAAHYLTKVTATIDSNLKLHDPPNLQSNFLSSTFPSLLCPCSRFLHLRRAKGSTSCFTYANITHISLQIWAKQWQVAIFPVVLLSFHESSHGRCTKTTNCKPQAVLSDPEWNISIRFIREFRWWLQNWRSYLWRHFHSAIGPIIDIIILLMGPCITSYTSNREVN